MKGDPFGLDAYGLNVICITEPPRAFMRQRCDTRTAPMVQHMLSFMLGTVAPLMVVGWLFVR